MVHLAAQLRDNFSVLLLGVQQEEVSLIRGIFQPEGHQLIFTEERFAAARHAQHKAVAAAFCQPVYHHKVPGNSVLAVQYPGGVANLLGRKGYERRQGFGGQAPIHEDAVQAVG